ncbi:hypothetical protein BN1007_10251 [Klebsiella variicola]|nr:hypothetical protein BN1007_10251 [Klebsiella variicola]CTQ25896.1 hypothetical protein BN1200_90039 [Klebsiella variicola]
MKNQTGANSIMFPVSDLLDLQTLSESVELEFKLAQGAEGKGKLPEDFWRTYSAMANTRGGYVVLGVREKKGKETLSLKGLAIWLPLRSNFLILLTIRRKSMSIY